MSWNYPSIFLCLLMTNSILDVDQSRVSSFVEDFVSNLKSSLVMVMDSIPLWRSVIYISVIILLSNIRSYLHWLMHTIHFL